MEAGSFGEKDKAASGNPDLARLASYATSIIEEHGEVERTPALGEEDASAETADQTDRTAAESAQQPSYPDQAEREQ